MPLTRVPCPARQAAEGTRRAPGSASAGFRERRVPRAPVTTMLQAGSPGGCHASDGILAVASVGNAAAAEAAQSGQPGRLIVDVEDHHDVRVAVVPVPTAMIRSMTPRTWAAVTAARSSSRPSRIASSIGSTTSGPAGSSAAISGYGRTRDHLRAAVPARSSDRTTGPGWWPRPAAASCSHRPSARSGHHPRAGSGPRPVPSAAARPARSRSSARLTRRHGHADALAPATIPPAYAPGPACTAPRRTAHTARPPRPVKHRHSSRRNPASHSHA
jgi:hypothetical protein